MSSSPHRSRDGSSTSGGEGRPRFFDHNAKKICWANAETVPGRHPERWRKDAAGNIVCKRLCNCHGCLCFQYDHIVPFSKGGESTAENCQILQTRVNNYKSDKEEVDKTQLKGYSCDLKFTGLHLPIWLGVILSVRDDVWNPSDVGHKEYSKGKRNKSQIFY
ncbi:uncharacterized protein LOC110639185 isoform X2 [Hevea brasiliensis]|uniref:uncharacterized protein LOC110639185 isoform X2 n=1 Tax=Hevea brasiliensis TaxID=3981 RepID=UPI0025E964EF|nr:uncharacterized protein LOC110639185 isoform X2 [Hevea brasiliensis]